MSLPHLLSKTALEFHPLALHAARSKRHAELKEPHDDVGEIPEEGIVILRVLLHHGAELLVLDEGHVGRQHHQGFGLGILELLGTVPFLPAPLLLEQQLVVVVGQRRGAEGPGPVEAGSIGVASAQGVRAREGDNLLVVETHAVEDVAQMAVLLAGIRQPAVARHEGSVAVGAARSPCDGGTLHLLDGGDAGEGPEVRVGDPGELLLDGFEEVSGGLETCVGAMVAFWCEAHGGTIGAACARFFVVAVVIVLLVLFVVWVGCVVCYVEVNKESHRLCEGYYYPNTSRQNHQNDQFHSNKRD